MPETYEATSNVTQASYLEFLQRFRDADEAVAEAVGARKDLRKIIKGAGINLKAFDRQRRDAGKSGEVREEEEREYRRYMQWIGKPVGYQAGFDFGDSQQRTEHDDQAVSEMQIRRVRDAGRVAGRSGVDRGRNDWTPGTLLASTWDEGWRDGAEELAQVSAKEEPIKRSRGRPKGSKNKNPRRVGNGAQEQANVY